MKLMRTCGTRLVTGTCIVAFAVACGAQEFIPEPPVVYFGSAPPGNVVQVQRGVGVPPGMDVLDSDAAGADGYVLRAELVSSVDAPAPAPPDGKAYIGTRATVFVDNVAQGQVVLEDRGAIYRLDFPNPARTPSPNAILAPQRIVPGVTPVSCGNVTCTPTVTRTFTKTPTITLTPTRTPSPTATPTGAAIAGSVALEGRPPAPNARWRVPLRVSLTRSGQLTPAYQLSPTTDDTGAFRVDGIAPDTYDILVKNPQTLQVKRGATLVDGLNSIAFGTLHAGDANDDNVVNLIDFSILRTTFSLASGQPGYDGRADFNGDALVNLLDFSLMRPNFSQLGEGLGAGQGGGGAAGSAAEQRARVAAVVVAPDTPVAVGGEVDVRVEIRAGEEPIDGAAAYVEYDPLVLAVVSVTPGTALPVVIQNESDVAGQVDYAAGTFDEFPTGTFILVTIRFRAIAPADGTRISLSKEPPRQTDAAFAGESVLTCTGSARLSGVEPAGQQTPPEGDNSTGEVGDGDTGTGVDEVTVPSPTPTSTPTPEPVVQPTAAVEPLAAAPESRGSGGGCHIGAGAGGSVSLLFLPLLLLFRRRRWGR